MAKCKHYKICGLEADPSTELCILHSKDPEKSLDTFNEALARHREVNGNNFENMVFPDVADFTGATFADNANFFNTIFTQRANFLRATFTQDAHFFFATFKNVADFTGATFKQDAHFNNPIFKQLANFSSATFERRAVFTIATFTGYANFDNATFTSEAHFINTKFTGGVRFPRSRFDGRTLFTGRPYSGQMIPIFSEAQEVDFSDVVFGASDVIFRHADFRKCRFLNTDLRQIHLADIKWARKRPRFTLARRKDAKWHRLCLYDEIAPFQGEERAWEQLETLYRQLKRNYEEQRDYERAGDFHYGEKEMRRQNPDTSWWHRCLLLWPYWLIGGYGERIWRPLVAAVVVLVAFAFVYLLCGLTPTKPSTSVHPLALTNIVTWGEALVYSFRVMTLQKPQDFVLSGPLIKLIYTLQGLIGPLLLGLLALAVRQRLKR